MSTEGDDRRGSDPPGQLDKTLFDAVYANMQRLKSNVGRDDHDDDHEEEKIDEQRRDYKKEVDGGDEGEDAWDEQGAMDWSEEEGVGYARSRGEYIVGGGPPRRRNQPRQAENLWGARMTGSLWGEANEWDRSDLTIEQVLKMQAHTEGVGEMSITQQLVVALNNQMNERMNDFSRQMEYIITLLVVLDTKVKHLDDRQAQFHAWMMARERELEDQRRANVKREEDRPGRT